MNQPDAWIFPDEIAAVVDLDARPAMERVLLRLLGPSWTVPDGTDPAVVAHFRALLDEHGLVAEPGRIRLAETTDASVQHSPGEC